MTRKRVRKMERINLGDRRPISTGKQSKTGLVVKIEVVDTEEQKGRLLTYDIEDYGGTQPYFLPDDSVTEYEVTQRSSRSRMPTEYVYKKAKDFKWDKYNESTDMQKEIVNRYVLQFDAFQTSGMGLYIFSKTKGSGKTMLACCIANEIINRKGIPVKFVTSQEYIEVIKEKSEDNIELLKTIKECRLLILDDIGAEDGGKDWTRNVIFGLVNYRHTHLLPTIYTSNYSQDELQEDERTTDRIISHSYPVALPEVPIRRNDAKRVISEFFNSCASTCGEETVF